MAKRSAGILLFKEESNSLRVFLVHPGGPFYRKKDLGSWSIPKGEFSEEEEGLQAAIREFREETGHKVEGDFIALTPIKQPSRKIVHAWAVEGKVDADDIRSNTFEIEWPPKSKKLQEFPEIDRASWFTLAEAMSKLTSGQVGFLKQLATLIGVDMPDDNEANSNKDSKGDNQITLFE